MTIGWVTEAEADTYFATRLGADSFWSSGTDKDAALQTAYWDIVDSGLFSLPTTANDTLKRAQYEQALFRLRGNDGVDGRGDLQAMNVIQAGILKEAYRYDNGKSPVMLSARVLGMLRPYITKGGARLIALSRSREDEGALDTNG